MKSSSAILAFQNILVADKILRYLNKQDLKTFRLICQNCNEVGFEVLSMVKNAEKLYIKFNESTWLNETIVKTINLNKIVFFEEYFKSEKSWVAQNIEISVKEGLECPNIRYMLKTYGHLIKNLRIVRKYDVKETCGNCRRPWNILNNECDSPEEFIKCVLNEYCPNLKSLSIIDHTADIHSFEYMDMEEEFNETQLNELILEFVDDDVTIYPENALPLGIGMSLVAALLRNSPQLKHFKLLPSGKNFYIHWIFQNLFEAGKKSDSHLKMFEQLETLSIGHLLPNSHVENDFEFINEENFPRLTTLKLQIKRNPPIKIFDKGSFILEHVGVKNVDIRFFSFFESKTESFEKLVNVAFPFANNIKLCLRQRINEQLFVGGINENYFKSDTSCYTIKSLTIDAGFFPDCVPMFLSQIGKICPNLETFDFGWIMVKWKDRNLIEVLDGISLFTNLQKLKIRLTKYDCIDGNSLKCLNSNLISVLVSVDEMEYSNKRFVVLEKYCFP